MFQNIMTNTTMGLNNIGFTVRQNAPGILMAGGLIGVIGSVVMACKATTKASQVLEEHEAKLDELKEAIETIPEYDEEDLRKDKVIVYTQTAWGFIKLYAPAAMALILSLAALFGSHYILNQRCVSLGAAYVALDKSFKDYRRRVAERYGEEAEWEIAHNVHTQEIEETDDKGKTKKKKVKVADPNTESPYVKYFTRSNPYWEDNEDFIIYNLSMRQSMLNDTLRAKGHVTLNEVYTALGFHETRAGMVCGWIYDTKNPNGDNYIELAIKEVYLPNEYTGTPEKAYSIDFNVDGNIYDKLVDPKAA